MNCDPDLIYEYGFPSKDKYSKLIEYLKEIWHWNEYIKYEDGKLELHTGGWSENEDIIDYLSKTTFWHLYWQKSERGGHYYFKIWDEKDMRGSEPNPNLEDDFEQW